MDLGRSLDYLETRSDIDIDKLGFYGLSSGGTHGVRFVAVDRRFKTAVLVSTALFVTPKPAETDPWHFAPRVRVPVLILNGRDDVIPYETAQRPLFDALGTKDKVFSRYSGGHASPAGRPDVIGEVLDWFDKHLGPVNQARN
jgi:dienelactone hydrolase